MREVSRSAIVAHPAAAMFDLVADVESYPQFLPGCDKATIIQRDGNEVVARLGLAQGPLQFSFTTRNSMKRPTSMSLALVDGPFRSLAGRWTFTPLGDGGTKLGLSLQFQFTNRLQDAALGLVFERTCNRLVDAFVSRADELYA